MQTSFTPAQLADPAIAEANGILRACVHCGFCTATCPTYVLKGDERDSPRGRIYLIKNMLEQGGPPPPETVTHIDRCLSCLACMTTCPSGVHYAHLVDQARSYIERHHRRPLPDRLLRALLAAVLPVPSRFRAALRLARPLRPLAPLLKIIGLTRLAAMLDLTPRRLPQPQSFTGTHAPAAVPRRRRVALLTGCAQSVLDPAINAATIRVLTKLGHEVVVPEGQGCCGALTHHLGRDDEVRATARRTIDAWLASGAEAIAINTSGCGTVVKDYGHLFADDPAYAEKAARVAAMACDISELISPDDLRAAGACAPRPLKLAYHAACSLQHGQKILRQPKELLAAAGFVPHDIPEGHICCGSAGTYNILQPEFAVALRTRKLANIASLKADAVTAGNIGCITQIASGTAVPVVHMIELIDWALGGPVPSKLECYA